MRSFLLTLSLTGLLVVVPALGAQSTDVKQSPELAKIEALSKQPVVPTTVGTLRLINSTGFVGTVTINGKDYTVLPSQTVLIPGMPTGEFRYEARADGFGILQPTVTRTLATAEMFTITLYPR